MKKKIMIPIIIVVLILIAGGAGYYYYITHHCPNISLVSKEVEANKYGDLTKLVKIDTSSDKYKVQVTNTNEQIVDLGKCGDYTLHYEVKRNDKVLGKKDFDITVVDTTKPTIKCEDTIKISEDTKELNINKYATITDNSSDTLDITIDGDYDLTKKGTYKVSIIAKDTSKNTSEKAVSLVVTKDSEESLNTSQTSGSNKVSSNGQKLLGYWVNTSKNMLILFKEDGNAKTGVGIVLSVLDNGASGSDAGGSVGSISKVSDNKYKVVYKDYGTNTTENLSVTISSGTMKVSSKYNSMNGSYTKWSANKVHKYWESH